WSRMVIVADRGKVVCFALATPGVATWFSFQSLLLSAGPETWVSEQPQQGWPLLKVRQSVAVLEAVPSVLDGALTVAKVVIGLSDIGQHPRVLGRQDEGSIGVGEGLFSKLVFCIEHAEHGLHRGLLGIQYGVLLQQAQRLGSRGAHLFAILQPGVSEQQVGPNPPILVVEFESLAGGCGGLGITL